MNNAPDATLLALLNASVAKLALDPKNDTLRTGIFQNQVLLTSKQLNITQTQAANAVRSYTSAYAYSKGQDPRAVLDALTSAQQQILNYDKNKPTLYGMDLVTANRFASYFAAAAGPVLFLALAAFVVALFFIGPEAAAAIAGASGVVEALTAVLGVSASSYGGVALLAGSFLFLVSQALGHFANFIPMATKQMVDNGTIAASLQITAIKNVTEIQAQLTGTKAPGSYTSAQFDSLVNGLQAAGITQVKSPVDNSVQPFSREALAGLVNYVYGTQIAAGSSATASKITPLLQPWLLKGVIPNSIPLSLYDQVAGVKVTTAPVASAAFAFAAAPTSRATTVSTPKIFTGVVTQGVLSSATNFTPRPDDLITSTADLETAAANNLAPYIASLPGRIIYEIKIVASVTTSSGFTQRGTTQRVQTGTYANGAAKYKTVTNKFAVLNLYILNKGGTRTALAQIVLGPTDSVQFQPTNDDLNTLQDDLQSGVHTSDTTQITSVQQVGSAPLAVSAGSAVSLTGVKPDATTGAQPVTAPPGAAAAPAPAQSGAPMQPTAAQLAARLNPQAFTVSVPAEGQVFRDVGDNIGASLYIIKNGSIVNIAQQSYTAQTDLLGADGSTIPAGTVLTSDQLRGSKIKNPGYIGSATSVSYERVQYDQQNGTGSYDGLPTFNIGDIQSVLAMRPLPKTGGDITLNTTTNTAVPAQNAPVTTSNAGTLADFYAAAGTQLPSVQDRQTTYQSLGLGAASMYVGTAEQNTKLVQALQQQAAAAPETTTQITLDRYEVIFDPATGYEVDDKLTGNTTHYPDLLSAQAAAPDTQITIDRYEVIYNPAKGWSVDDKLTGDTKYYATKAAAFAAAR